MQKFSTATFSSSCSIPIRTFILGTKKQQKQNNQFISNQTNIVLSKINFKCELLCSYCLHFIYADLKIQSVLAKNDLWSFYEPIFMKNKLFSLRSAEKT